MAQVFKPYIAPVKPGSLTVRISGFENNNGECWFALDNSEDVYESEDSVFIGKILPIKNNEVIVEIDSLSYGVYAIRVFHDENSNGELDTNILGIPTEDYGYSNDVSAWFGPPSWERAQFLFNKENIIIEVSVD
jgi:uncharacterized protein (DUF2141 family)